MSSNLTILAGEKALELVREKGLCPDDIRTIAGEGRKFGLGLCCISQRPAKIDKNVISQCSTQILLKITNPNDLRSVIASSEGVSSESEQEIQRLITRRSEGYLPVGSGLLVKTGNNKIPYMICAPTMITPEAVEPFNAYFAMSAISKSGSY